MIDATEGGEGGGGKGLTDEEIVVHSIVFLLAGYETTSNTLAYISYLLALNPEIQEKLQTTIDEYFENNPVSGGATSDMIIDMLTNHAPASEVYCHKWNIPLITPHSLTLSLITPSTPHRMPPCTMPYRSCTTWTWWFRSPSGCTHQHHGIVSSFIPSCLTHTSASSHFTLFSFCTA